LRAAPVALLMAVACAAGPAGPADGPRPGSFLPDVDLLDAAGRPLRTADLRGKVLVLNLFAFWCDTWKAQLPQLIELAAAQEALDFRLVSVSVDGRWREELAATCGARALPFPVLADVGGRLSAALGVRRVPTVLLLDARGRIAWVHEGYPGNLQLLRAIRAVLSRPVD